MRLSDFNVYRKKLETKHYIFIAIIVYTIAFSTIEIIIYHSFRIFTWDLGIFNQALWNTLHGKFLYYTPELWVYTETGCFLAAHFSPIILLAIPLYAIYPSGETLLVISTFIVALGALPIYEIAKLFLKDEKTALKVGLLYLLYPSLQGVTLSGFSPESFAVTIFPFITYYLLKNDLKRLAVASILGLMTHENSSLVIAAIGVYGMLHHRKIRNRGFQASLAVSAISIPYFFFANYMRGFFGWNGRPSLWHEWAVIGANGASELPLIVILNPLGALNALASDGTAKLLYIILMFLPLLFIPFLGLRGMIPAIPYLSASLLSTYRLYYSLEGHYGAFVAPFIFLAFIHGLTKVREASCARISVSKLTTITFLATLIIFAVILPTVYSQYEVFNLNVEHNSTVRDFIARIPLNASILTQSNIFPHISNRPNAYTIAPPSWSPEYLQVDLEILAKLRKMDIEYVLLDFAADPQYSIAASFIYTEFVYSETGRYVQVDAKDGVVLFQLKR